MHEIDPPSGQQWRIAAGDHEAVVVEVGGGLRTYRIGEHEILDGYRADEICPGTAGQILAPWPNRIRDGRYRFDGETHQLPLSEPANHNAIHGLVCWQQWRLVERTDSCVSVEHVLPAQPGYPWTLRLSCTWSVGPDGLRARHTATNLSGRPAPFGLGAHPYLRLPGRGVDDVTLLLPARSRLLSDGRGLPIGAARVAGGEFDFAAPRRIGGIILDTAFGDLPEQARNEVRLGADGAPDRGSEPGSDGGPDSITVWADPVFRWWQVYTGDTLPAARARRAVAVEPMTCPPDAFHSGRDLIHLEPGRTWQAEWGISSTVRPR
jgi:aldose 1-epimerase